MLGQQTTGASAAATKPSYQSKCLNPNMTPEETCQAWDEMAPEYNAYVAGIKYKGPEKVAEVAEGLFPDTADRANVKVMDLACGTGLVGEAMARLGFSTIDGVDPSPHSLSEAESKDVYRKMVCSYVGVEGKPLPVKDNSYDLVTVCGSMGQNMMPCSGVLEMMRLVRPGGYVINIFREEILTNVAEYKDRLEPLMAALEQQGAWRRVAREAWPGYHVGRVGIINVHQVL